MREQRRLLRQEDRDRRRQERRDADRNTVLLERKQGRGDETESKKTSQLQFYQLKAGEEFRSFGDMAHKQKLQKYVGFTENSSVLIRPVLIALFAKCLFVFRASLEERLKLEESSGISSTADTAVGSKQLTFTLKKVHGCK